MAGDGSLRATTLSEEERTTLDDSVDTLEDDDDLEPDYTPTEHLSKPTLSPDYTPAGLELLISEYEPNADEEDTATSPETSPPRPTPTYWSYSTPTGTRVKQTPRKVAATPHRRGRRPTIITTDRKEISRIRRLDALDTSQGA
ncbi:unnamed protein product [Lactuca virosa]|uniref:Uncharacterized protein n=1 Tax=Lactuca virosa TaxID=75947 RepID=A0AAU9P3X0_9ASTR|nr:unnamed protein product [Lactuca virosa]